MPKDMGYLMIDHRASPGLPEDVARWAGYDVKLTSEGKLWETKTLCCSHCNACVVPTQTGVSYCTALMIGANHSPLT